MFYLDLVEEAGLDRHPPDRQFARRLARRRDPDPRPLALPQPRPTRAGRHPGQGRAVRRQFHLGPGGGGAQPLSRPVLRRPHPGADAERGAAGRDAAQPLHGGEVRLAAALVQPRSREVAAPHQAAGAGRLGRRRQDHAAGQCGAVARAAAGCAARHGGGVRAPAACRARRRSSRAMSSSSWREWRHEARLLPSDAVPAARPRGGGEAPLALGGAAEPASTTR